VSVTPKVVTERHPALLRQGFCRGIDYQVTINEDIILPEQQYLFGEVLHQFLTGLSSLNTFVRLTLFSQQRGERQQWQAQLGKSSTL
jgi:type VI secretion system protein ImpG